VISQRLLPRIGSGRIAAVEVMVSNDRIAELIREGRAEEIPAAIADGSFYDMRTLTQALIDLVLAGLVEDEVAASAAPNRHDFMLALEHAKKAHAVAASSPAMRRQDEPEPKAEPAEPEPAESETPPLRLVRVPGEAPLAG
jgi:Tfp pilus assembly ATPase PilU